MDLSRIANRAKRSAFTTVQTDIGDCASCASMGLGCDCAQTGVPHCSGCKKKMGLGAMGPGSILGVVLLLVVGTAVAWKMGCFGTKVVASRKKRRKR